MAHSVTLSSHWTNQSYPYPNHVESLPRKWQVSIFKSLTRPWFKLEGSSRTIYQNRSWTVHSFSHPIWFPTQSHYPDTELTSPWSILPMPRVMLCSDSYQLNKLLLADYILVPLSTLSSLTLTSLVSNSYLFYRKPALSPFNYCDRYMRNKQWKTWFYIIRHSSPQG